MFNRSHAVLLTALLLAPLLAPAASPNFQNKVLKDGPALYYQFNSPTGNEPNLGALGAAFDLVFNGTITRGVPTNAGDTGVEFDAAEDFLESVNSAPLAFLGNPTFSAEAVVYVPVGAFAQGWPPFLHWGDGLPFGIRTGHEVYFSLSANINNRAFAGFYNGGLRTAGTLQLGTWNHIAWVRQGGGNAITGSVVYVNGSPVAVEADPNLCCNATAVDVNSAAFRVNRARDGVRFFQGRIDELVLYDHALTAADVCEHYKAFYQPIDADMNCDQVVTVSDISGFVLALTNPAGYATQFPCCNALSGDVNGDGSVSVSDIGGFVAILTN